MDSQSSIARRNFIKGAAGMFALAAAQPLAAQVPADEAGITFVTSPADRDRAAALLNQVFIPFMGDWVGTRQSVDTGVAGPVQSTQHYALYLGGPQVVADVRALVDGVAVFAAAKHYVYSPARDTILTYFFEIGGTVQLFELDRGRIGEGKLFWTEILRKGQQFRVEETIPQNDEWTATVFMQDPSGEYQVFARNQLRRNWREAFRMKSPTAQKAVTEVNRRRTP